MTTATLLPDAILASTNLNSGGGAAAVTDIDEDLASTTVFAAFDGSTYLTRDAALTGAPGTATTATIFFGLKIPIGSAAFHFLRQSAGSTSVVGLRAFWNAGNIAIAGFTSGSTKRVDTGSTIAAPDDGAMHWYYITWDQSSAALRFVYTDGVDTTPGSWTNFSASSWSPNIAAFSIGADTAAGSPLTGELANVYFDTSYQAAAGAAAFYTGGAPTDPATAWPSNGLIKLYNPIATWEVNQGTGGGFTEHGTLTLGSG